jgi:tetratricopeptide (TPR) repeat protein
MPSETVADLINEAWSVERSSADMATALKLAQKAQALANKGGQPDEMAETRLVVARYRFRLGQYAAAQALAREALALTNSPDDKTSAIHAGALLMLGMCAGETGQLDEAEQSYIQAADLARESCQPVLHYRALHNLATVYGPQGRFGLAIANDEQARRIALQHGLSDWLYFSLITLAWNLQITRQPERARVILGELHRVSMPESAGRAYCAYIQALLDMDEGRLEPVVENLSLARDVAE